MTRMLAAALVLLLVAARRRAGAAGRPRPRLRPPRARVTLKAKGTDAVGGAVKVIAGNRVLAGGSAGGQFVVVRLRRTGALDSRVRHRRAGRPRAAGHVARRRARAGDVPRRADRRRRHAAAADGTTRFAAVRLLPTGEIDPSFGGGLGYVLAGPANAVLGAMVMDRAGNVILGGSPGRARRRSCSGCSRTAAPTRLRRRRHLRRPALGLAGRVTSLLVRPEGPILFSVGGPGAYPATFTVVRLGATGAPDPTFAGTGVANIPLGTGAAAGVGAQAIRSGPSGSTLVAGTDLTDGRHAARRRDPDPARTGRSTRASAAPA